MSGFPSVLETLLAKGRDELLQQLFEGIDMCERSLNDYLEQKKKAFLVSSSYQTRLYILSMESILRKSERVWEIALIA